jgi:hypothetical protein
MAVYHIADYERRREPDACQPRNPAEADVVFLPRRARRTPSHDGLYAALDALDSKEPHRADS